MELVRRSLLGARALRMFPELSEGTVLLRLVVSAAATLVLAAFAFAWADRNARRRGLIDQQANW
jgi:hypothetical protein